MASISAVALEIGLLAGLVAATGGALWLGQVWGARQRRRHTGDEPQYEVIQGATLALLGLLLGFSFSGASSRFIERQDLIVREANAIGTAYLRADLLPVSERDQLRSALRAYGTMRLALAQREASGRGAADAHQEVAAQQMAIWGIVIRGVEKRPDASQLVAPPVNDLIDLLAARDAATRRHVPIPVMITLWVCAAVSLGSVGYGIGRAGRTIGTQAVLLGVLICASIAVTIDLDYPMRGFIQLDMEPLRAAQAALQP
jgi:hypothetical protein